MAKKPTTSNATEAKVKKVKATGFAPLKFQNWTISQKSSGRFEVVTANGANVNGKEKEKILLDAKILKPSLKKEAAVETPAT